MNAEQETVGGGRRQQAARDGTRSVPTRAVARLRRCVPTAAAAALMGVLIAGDALAVAAGTTVNVGIGGRGPRVDGDLIAFIAPEGDHGGDLYGDGDADDSVVHVYDAETEEPRS